jgi:hypothetical protein
LEKFEVAKLKNLKVIKGGEVDQIPTNDLDITDMLKKVSSGWC